MYSGLVCGRRKSLIKTKSKTSHKFKTWGTQDRRLDDDDIRGRTRKQAITGLKDPRDYRARGGIAAVRAEFGNLHTPHLRSGMVCKTNKHRVSLYRPAVAGDSQTWKH